jgi:hypothetical protein
MLKSWVALALAAPLAAQTSGGDWKFAVSGDSRNCGNIVMPAIAHGVLQSGATFYWHLGDFRAIYTFDEDLVKPLNIITYSSCLSATFRCSSLPAITRPSLPPPARLT